MLDIFHVASLIRAFRRDGFLAKEARMRRLAGLEDMTKAGLGIFGRDAKEGLHGAVIHPPALADQIVILLEDVHGAIHLCGFTLDRQPIIMEESRDLKGRLEEFDVLVQSAKKILYLPGNLYRTSHRL